VNRYSGFLSLGSLIAGGVVLGVGLLKHEALHQLVYPAAILGVIHYLWLVQADTREPLIYLAILLVLLGFRLPWSQWVNDRQRHESSRTEIS
jgi:DMSO/TMAO reductase YedYZ heme-binding membrane subunit